MFILLIDEEQEGIFSLCCIETFLSRDHELDRKEPLKEKIHSKAFTGW